MIDRKTGEGKGDTGIRIDRDVWKELVRRMEVGDSHNDVLRKILKLDGKGRKGRKR